ncbi:hypothetical protein KL86DPRO_60256 [uncultured delta proteobacterium]|uniref:Uncharacterized protein n=1 Tax=uncultured delta proteobacterium TaxID=34034 RepID=A0A212KG39_9DELT|nr:hypothetical protein KL86DPRO_60245 [uncultured delta proteobacterium]SBW10690.1 hypothetical protein KL86DPRO_60256 [uncultured delta proteobacterium]
MKRCSRNQKQEKLKNRAIVHPPKTKVTKLLMEHPLNLKSEQRLATLPRKLLNLRKKTPKLSTP